MNESRIQKTVYLTSIDFSDQIQDVMKLKGFGSFSGYINHLICKDIESINEHENNQVEGRYNAYVRMYRDFSFTLIDAKKKAKGICLIEFPKKFESFIKNLD